MSRHGSGCPMEIGVATPIFEVATWAVLIGQKGGRDLRPRPGRYARDLRTLSVRPALAVRATSLLCAQQRPRPGHCARCVRATWVVGCAHCAPNPVLIQCIVYSNCLDHCSWTLFMKTVHRVKKEYKNFKNFLACDLIYEIFILCLL